MIIEKLLELARNILDMVGEFDAAGIINLIKESVSSLIAILDKKEGE